MIHKSELLGKYVTYNDPQRGCRTEKVVRTDGSYITVQDAVKVKRRIHKDCVEGRQLPKRGIEEIDWSRQKPKKISEPEEQKSESAINKHITIIKPQKQLKIS